MLMRGGSSKGAYFLAEDLPADPTERDRLLLHLMGSPDERQIDGLGGAHPLTSKVAVVGPSTDPGIDLDYLFLQVVVDEPLVSDSQNCGNLLAGVAPFAIERRLIDPEPDATSIRVRIRMLNTDSVAVATLQLADGWPVYDGETAISGVPGTAAPIRLDFAEVAGGSCGALFPTGRPVDEIGGVACTLVDNGMPVVVLTAEGLGSAGIAIDGHESPSDLEANEDLRRRLETIRLEAGRLMNLGDVAASTVPKLSIVSAPGPDSGGGVHLDTRTFIPHRCHEAIGVLGALSVATAAVTPGAPAQSLATISGLEPTPEGGDIEVVLGHPTGQFTSALTVAPAIGEVVEVTRSGFIRTARKLMDGSAF